MERPVEELKKYLRETGKHGLGVDLDETASNTISWWVEKMLTNFGNPENLSAAEIIAKYSYVQLVPYWQNRPEVDEWIEHHRTSNEVQTELPLIEGANELLQKINLEIEPIVAYITARPELVRPGTQQWLDRHGFPQAPVIMQSAEPNNFKDNHIWKASVVAYLYPELTGFVDDNPGLIECLPDDYQGNIFLFGGAVCPREGLNVFECNDWVAVHSRIATLHGQQQ